MSPSLVCCTSDRLILARHWYYLLVTGIVLPVTNHLVAISLSAVVLRHKSKKPIVLLKLDFEKVLDKVERSVIVDILRHKGYGDIFCGWVTSLLGNATSVVMLNGKHGTIFKCRRGVR